jgi:hypothetical protein
MIQGNSLETELAAKKIDADKIVELVSADPKLIESVLQGLSNKAPRVKFGCSKSLLLLSEKYPELLYTKIEGIFGLLDCPNQILKWNGTVILGNLAAVDGNRRIKSALPKIFGFLSCGELITANNAIHALGKIGRAFPEEQGKITSRLLGIGRAVFDTDECRNIAIGKSILALETFIDPAKARKNVREFVRIHAGNRRPATAAKAKSFLRKCSF